MAVHTSESAPILINCVDTPQWPAGYGKIGMTFAPGKVQAQSMTGVSWNRDLDMDLARLKNEYQTDTLISLMRDNEYTTYKIDNIFEKSKLHCISLVHYPIQDLGVPSSIESALALVKDIVEVLKDGKNVVVHCLGGLGRTGLVVACVVVYIFRATLSANESIALVRQARKGAVQTYGQVTFVEEFYSYLYNSK